MALLLTREDDGFHFHPLPHMLKIAYSQN